MSNRLTLTEFSTMILMMVNIVGLFIVHLDIEDVKIHVTSDISYESMVDNARMMYEGAIGQWMICADNECKERYVYRLDMEQSGKFVDPIN